MQFALEHLVNYPVATIAVLLIFYGIYFGKMLLQKRKGIRTHQIGSRREKKLHRVELLMSIATVGIVIAQVFSLVTEWSDTWNMYLEQSILCIRKKYFDI